MTGVERYLAELGSRLNVGTHGRARILTEVADHLDDAIAHRVQSGQRRNQAETETLNAFGSPRLIARQFNAAAGSRAMRRAPIVAIAAGIGVFSGFVFAGTTQPLSATPTNAALATQIAFFVSVLAFEVAVVAGVCAASRALSVWQLSAARGADRAFVRHCAIVSTGALGVAATGWATTMALAVNHFTAPNRATLLVGALVMALSAGSAIVAALRLRVNPMDVDGDAPDDTTGLFGIGELVIGCVRRYPVASCAAAAALSVVPAMSHAETTVAGALPWGAVQAVAVVFGFVVLGPSLELRRTNRV
jgi:uncharacterized membrane protein